MTLSGVERKKTMQAVLLLPELQDHFHGRAEDLATKCHLAGIRETDLLYLAKFAQEALNTVSVLDYVKRRAARDQRWLPLAEEWLTRLCEVRAWAKQHQETKLSCQAAWMGIFVQLVHGYLAARCMGL
jgi:hypothetical protein